MSRHSKKHPTKENLTLVYGFDRPRSQYFWQAWDSAVDRFQLSLNGNVALDLPIPEEAPEPEEDE